MTLCEGCQGARYRLATRSDGKHAVERCDTCNLDMTDDAAVLLALNNLYHDIDEWFEGDERDRTATEMLDWARSFLNSMGANELR